MFSPKTLVLRKAALPLALTAALTSPSLPAALANTQPWFCQARLVVHGEPLVSRDHDLSLGDEDDDRVISLGETRRYELHITSHFDLLYLKGLDKKTGRTLGTVEVLKSAGEVTLIPAETEDGNFFLRCVRSTEENEKQVP